MCWFAVGLEIKVCRSVMRNVFVSSSRIFLGGDGLVAARHLGMRPLIRITNERLNVVFRNVWVQAYNLHAKGALHILSSGGSMVV